jgi:PhnB protein
MIIRVSPYLYFQGNCEEALNYYAQALNGKVEMAMRYGDAPQMNAKEEQKNWILHAVLKLSNELTIQAADGMNEGVSEKANMSISVEFDSMEDINSAFEKLSEGGKVTMPLENTFWNARFGMCIDKFGFAWMFNYKLPQQ